MNTTPTQQPAPDHGEPWQLTTDFAFDITIRGELAASFDKIEHANRAVSCVNACAGMADPEKEIKAMREVIREASSLLGAFDGGAVDRLNWHNRRADTLAKLQPFTKP